MKQVHSNVLISSATACVLLAAQPVLAQTTQITEVKLNPADGGISVILTTSSGDKPQVFTTKRDKAFSEYDPNYTTGRYIRYRYYSN
ncbi:hypothetical protein [Anabaena sphaerica]|uniref:hypothetical protein n=1 Tax=Anabaena sphaerica TaxID=212446 RepID=UPI0018EF6770|nr:hypothetical protein [Anabaena sphaerica]